MLRFFLLEQFFSNKSNCVRVVIEIVELSNIFGVSHMEPLPLKRECVQKRVH